MAIFHATTKPISRSSGRSSTASAAYRAGCEIIDERTGLRHDYSKRSGVVITAVFDKDLKSIDRNILWNLAEKSENRKDARTAREWILAIPHELIPKRQHTRNEREYQDTMTDINQNHGIWVAFTFAHELAKRYNVGVDIAIHAPDKEGDNRNFHAHVMTTTRELKNENGQISLGDKSTIELSNAKRKKENLGSTISEIKELRKVWADIVNSALEANDIRARIDHRSHKERELESKPMIKIGWQAMAMERRGIATNRGNINRAIIIDNAQIKKLRTEITAEKHLAKWAKQGNTRKNLRIERDILKRTAFDLLNIRVIATAKDDNKLIRSLSSENIPIGKLLYKTLIHKRNNKEAMVTIEAPSNSHLDGSKTAKEIKKLLFEKITEFADSANDNNLGSVLRDYGSLSIGKFAAKYDIECDLEGLRPIHDKNPVIEIKEDKKPPVDYIKASTIFSGPDFEM